jgi:hypothetical protein
MFSLSHVRCDAPNAQSILVRADSNTHDFLIYSGQSLNRVARSTFVYSVNIVPIANPTTKCITTTAIAIIAANITTSNTLFIFVCCFSHSLHILYRISGGTSSLIYLGLVDVIRADFEV